MKVVWVGVYISLYVCACTKEHVFTFVFKKCGTPGEMFPLNCLGSARHRQGTSWGLFAIKILLGKELSFLRWWGCLYSYVFATVYQEPWLFPTIATHEAAAAQRGVLARERRGEKCTVSRWSKPKPHAADWLISHGYPCYTVLISNITFRWGWIVLGEYPCSRFIHVCDLVYFPQLKPPRDQIIQVHFSIETHGWNGIPNFKKCPYFHGDVSDDLWKMDVMFDNSYVTICHM